MTPRVRLAFAGMMLCVSRSQQTAAQAVASSPIVDASVDIGGHKLHIHCAGPPDARPIVILESGGGGTSRDWTAVQRLLSPRVGSCAYDRAGLGSSQPGPAPRTMRQEVFELHTLLDSARVSGPFVLAGQSIGGLLVRLYVDQYGADVVGAVLVDPTHESDMLGSVRYGGWVRLREKSGGRPIPEPRVAGPISTSYNPDDDYLADELEQIYLARKSNPEPFGKRPLIVLAAGKRPAPPGTPAEQWEQLRVERDGHLVDLSRLSSNARLVLDPASTHAIHIENAALVARSIEEVLAAASTGVALVP